MKKNKAFTLLEILVTTAILIVLISFLVVIVRTSMNTWKISEDRSALFAQARRLFEIFQEDLSSVMVPRDPANQEIMLIGDHDIVLEKNDQGKDIPGKERWLARLRFVRAFRGEANWWISREAGRQLLSEKYIDQDDDYKEANLGLLKPPGGMMEVIYMQDPTPGSRRLLRGVRAPIGGSATLFKRDNLKQFQHFQVLADNVLYLEFRYWTPWTTGWALPLGENIPDKELKKSPLICWDSTRKIFLTEEYREGYEKCYKEEFKKFPILTPPGSAHILPQKILITLVLKDPRFSEEAISLAQKIDDKTKTIYLSSTAKLPRGEWELPYLLIDNEWIRYESISGTQVLLGERGARGARLTLPTSHDIDSSVQIGRTFRWVVELPCSGWNFREK